MPFFVTVKNLELIVINLELIVPSAIPIWIAHSARLSYISFIALFVTVKDLKLIVLAAILIGIDHSARLPYT